MSSQKERIRTALFVFIASTIEDGYCYSSVSVKRKPNLTQRRYRPSEDGDMSLVYGDQGAAAIFAAEIYSQKYDITPIKPPSTLPTWLHNLSGDRADEKLYALKDAMAQYLSEQESHIVQSAILEASGGNLNKMAGAAEFCLILVETTEMGVETLVAAAFHYCTCVEARETTSQLFENNSAYFWDELYDYEFNHGIDNFSEGAIGIAHNAARLKRAEMVSSSFMLSTGNSNHVTPDANDAENLRNLLLSETEDWRALGIRAAACLYRLRGLLSVRASNMSLDLTAEESLISREGFRIYAPLASQLGMYRLKNEIEGAAFQLLYRRQYEAVTSLTVNQRLKSSGIIGQSEEHSTNIADGMRVVLKGLSEKVKNLLRNDPTFMENVEKVFVSARVKEPYSLWKKMLKLGTRNVLDVPDAIALRVVLDASKLCEEENENVRVSRSTCLCYYIHKLFAENCDAGRRISRIKDYILNPKANGYQSLHFTSTTFWNNQEWPFEMQIRTGEMHRTAEYGVAAHWDYKLQGKEIPVDNYDDYSSISMSELESQWSELGKGNYRAFGSGRRPQFEGSTFDKPNVHNNHFLEVEQIRADRNKARDEHLAPYIEALRGSIERAKKHLAKEKVFIFLSLDSEDGKFFSLPSGSCIIDAQKLIERTYGIRFDLRNDESNILHNGAEASITQKLSNGDVLIVPSFEL